MLRVFSVLFLLSIISNATYGLSFAQTKPCITESFIKNGKYPLTKTSNMHMHNGYYNNPQEFDANILDFVIGNINKDGSQDAAVIVAQNMTGGNGHEILLYILKVNCNTKLGTMSGPRDLGNRVNAKIASLNAGVVKITGTFHGPKDPMCCPTQKKVLYFKKGQEGIDAVN